MRFVKCSNSCQQWVFELVQPEWMLFFHQVNTRWVFFLCSIVGKFWQVCWSSAFLFKSLFFLTFKGLLLKADEETGLNQAILLFKWLLFDCWSRLIQVIAISSSFEHSQMRYEFQLVYDNLSKHCWLNHRGTFSSEHGHVYVLSCVCSHGRTKTQILHNLTELELTEN